MRTIKLTLSYDGTDFVGWQAQSSGKTLQSTLEAAITRITGEKISILASGRTDSGVHALRQVASFRTESLLSADILLRALNAQLPRSMSVSEATDVHDGFHPTYDAIRKRYRYVIHDGPCRDVFRRNFVWHFVYGRLDTEAMTRAAAPLVGTHDFSSFQTSGAPRKTSIRTVHELFVERGRGDQRDFITLEIEADGFLYNMVRTIVGTLVEVARGARPENWPAEVLAAKNRRAAGPTAPPHGLFLVNVDY